jgi:hypothetical protein
LDQELRDFLEMAAQEKMKEGMSRKDALRAVRLDQGSLEVTKEVVRAAGWESFVETCWQDLLLDHWPTRAAGVKDRGIRDGQRGDNLLAKSKVRENLRSLCSQVQSLSGSNSSFAPGLK